MAHLCAMKRTANLTDTQMDIWHGVLSGFRPEIINRATLELGVSADRFPELGDIWKICRREAIRRGEIEVAYSPSGNDKDIDRPGTEEMKALAERLGLKI